MKTKCKPMHPKGSSGKVSFGFKIFMAVYLLILGSWPVFSQTLIECSIMELSHTTRAFGFLDEDYLYVGRYENLLTVIDVSDFVDPVIIANIELPGSNVHDIWGAGNKLFTAHRFGAINLIDITEPRNPLLLDTKYITYTHKGITGFENYMFVSEHSSGRALGGFRIYDTSENEFFEIGQYLGQIDGREIVVTNDGNVAYLSTATDDWDPQALYVFDVTSKASPQIKKIIPGLYAQEMLLSSDNRYLFMSYSQYPGSSDRLEGIKIFDISNRTEPLLVSTIKQKNIYDLAVDEVNQILFAREYVSDDMIYGYSISDPGRPIKTMAFNIDEDDPAGDFNGSGDMIFSDGRLYVLDEESQLTIYLVNYDSPDAGKLWISPTEISCLINSSFSISIHLDSGNQPLAAYTLELDYDPLFFSLDSSFGNEGIVVGSDGFMAASSSATPGRLVVTGFDVDGKGPGRSLHLLNIAFRSKNISGQSKLELKPRVIATTDTSTIGTPFGVGAVVHVEELLRGDVNKDGKVDILDALLLARFSVSGWSGDDLSHCDLNCDGEVNIIDALLVALYYVGENRFCDSLSR